MLTLSASIYSLLIQMYMQVFAIHMNLVSVIPVIIW